MKRQKVKTRMNRHKERISLSSVFLTKFLALIISITLLPGCVGIWAINNSEKTYEPEKVALGDRGHLSLKYPPKRLIKAEVVDKWGDPDEKVKESSSERWVYKQKKLSWAGLMPFIIVPIPLVIPTGHNKASLTFSEELLIKVKCEEQKIHNGFICGLWVNEMLGGSSNRDPACYWGEH